MLTDDPPTLVLGLEDDAGPATDQPTWTRSLLFGLSLATGLPPAAMVPPPGSPRPKVRAEAQPVLGARELMAILGSSSVDGWSGRIALGEVDARLGGLEIVLSVFQVTDGSGALVSLSAIRRDPRTSSAAGASPADLWALACQALAHHGITHEQLSGPGERAFLAIYGGVTAQVAWLAGGCLATASVTCLTREPGWAVAAARAIAPVLDGRLRGHCSRWNSDRT
jgi:hypothetical protein